MTLDPFLDNTVVNRSAKTPSSRNFTLNRLQAIIKALHQIKDKYDKKFNFTRLAKQLNISPQELSYYASIILQFQELNNSIFTN